MEEVKLKLDADNLPNSVSFHLLKYRHIAKLREVWEPIGLHRLLDATFCTNLSVRIDKMVHGKLLTRKACKSIQIIYN